MELLLDTANLEAIKKYNDYYAITGVTTNPTILAREKVLFSKLMTQFAQSLDRKSSFMCRSPAKTVTKC